MSNTARGYLWKGGPDLPHQGVWEWVELKVTTLSPDTKVAEAQPVTTADAAGNDQAPAQFAVALGAQAEDCLNWLRDQNLRRLALRGEQPPVLKTLILALPALPQDALKAQEIKKGLTRNIVAMDGVARVIVFVCPADTTIESTNEARLLGRDGPLGPMHHKVDLIDVSNLLDDPRNGVASLCRSCEALGLIERLARGMPVDTALGKCKAVRVPAPSS